MMAEPSMGRIVRYVSRTGNYQCAATKRDLFQPNVDAGYIAGLKDSNHVHLTVFTPGKPGKRATADDFVGDRANEPISENVSGTYQEWDVPYDPAAAAAAGTWHWPERTDG